MAFLMLSKPKFETHVNSVPSSLACSMSFFNELLGRFYYNEKDFNFYHKVFLKLEFLKY